MLYLWGVHLPKLVHLPSCVYQYSRHLLYLGGVHLPKYAHLPCFVYWYSRQISPVRVEICYCHLVGVLGVFQGVVEGGYI